MICVVPDGAIDEKTDRVQIFVMQAESYGEERLLTEMSEMFIMGTISIMQVIDDDGKACTVKFNARKGSDEVPADDNDDSG